MKKFKAVIASDVHTGQSGLLSKLFGDGYNQADLLSRLLPCHLAEILVLNGDIFNTNRGNKFSRGDLRLFENIAELEAQGTQIVWIKGNHDFRFRQNVPHCLIPPMLKDYRFVAGGKTFWVTHGNRYDKDVWRDFNPEGWLLYFIDQAAGLLARAPVLHDGIRDRVSYWTTATIQAAEAYAQAAIAEHADVVCIGHTHMHHRYPHNGVTVLNSGCWMGGKLPLITVNEEGEAKILVFDTKGELIETC